MDRERESAADVLPPGWGEQLVTRADLELSFDRLNGAEHFYAEALRGRLRSLQLRTTEAARHFGSALGACPAAPENLANLVREFVLRAYSFENDILECTPGEAASLTAPWLPTLRPEILEVCPEVRAMLSLRKAMEGLLRLHSGESEFAVELFRGLLEESTDGRPDERVMHYLGLGAAFYNLGQKEDGLRNMENAGLTLLTGGELLSRARGAGILFGFYLYLEQKKEAESWRLFLDRLDCPRPTKVVFLKRGELLATRCHHNTSLVVL